MSTDSPSSESTPPKKPIIPKEATEMDLWDMDTLDQDAPAGSEPVNRDPSGLPSRREKESSIRSRKPAERQISPPAPVQEPEKKAEPRKTAKKSAKRQPAPENDTPLELDDNEPVSPAHDLTDSPDTETTDKPAEKQTAPQASASILTSLTKTEKIGTAALVAILAISAIFAVVHFSNRVPTRSVISESLDLPIEGKHVKVTSVSTYWREPVNTGDTPDIVRRGTNLIPVIRISVESKSAAIRVLFRNENGEVIGDPINREVKGKAELRIPATAGFDDIGMHAAYRTGESLPWVVQVLESTDSRASIDKFTTLLETEISTDIR